MTSSLSCWRNFCNVDVIFVILVSLLEKIKHKLHQQLMHLFSLFWVCKIKIWGHYNAIWCNFVYYDVVFVILTSILVKFKRMLQQQLITLFNALWVRKIIFVRSNLTSLWPHFDGFLKKNESHTILTGDGSFLNILVAKDPICWLCFKFGIKHPFCHYTSKKCHQDVLVVNVACI